MDFEWVFYEFTVGDLLLAAGRYVLIISAFLLALRHAVWFWRRKWRCYWHVPARRKFDQERYIRHKIVRNAMELLVSANLTVLYGWHIWSEGAIRVLGDIETIAVVWSIALLFVALLVSRQEPVSDDP